MKFLKGFFVHLLFVLLFSFFFLQTAIDGKESITAKVTTTGGIHVAEFTTLHGKIYLNLPGDMAGGEPVSGKLTLKPLGLKDKQKTKNLKSLKKYMLELGGQTTPASKKWDKWNIPHAKKLSIILKNPKGKMVAEARVSVDPVVSTAGIGDFRCDEVCLAGSIFSYKGQFDGDFANTEVRIGGKELEKWAESPRQVIVASPYDVVGSTTVSLKEGNFKDQCLFRNIVLKSQIGETTLQKGEKTQLVITVKGLEGLARKIPLRLENKTPGIVSIKQEELITIQPWDVKTGGIYVYERTLTGIAPGKFHISVVIVTEDDCKKILKIYNEVKNQFDKQDKNCRKLAQLVGTLKRKKADAEAKRDKWKKELENKNKEIKKAKDVLKKAKQKLKDLINFAIHLNEISTEPKAGLDNSIGLFRGEVRIYFSGSQTSVNIISWFLNEYRDKWNKLRNECRDAEHKLKGLQKKKKKAETELKKDEQNLKKADEKLEEAEKRLKECLKGKRALDDKLKDLGEKYKRCLRRLEAQRKCKSNTDDATGAINGAQKADDDAQDTIDKTNKKAGGLKTPSQKADQALDQAKKLLEEAEELERRAKQARDEAKKAFDNGDLGKANKLADEAEKLADEAKKKADEAKNKAEKAQSEIEKAKNEQERIEQRERELEQREKEWWDEFLTEDNPTPHDIRGGKKNLSIGLYNLLDSHIMNRITMAKFGGRICEDKCLIAVRNTFGEQWMEVLKDIAWDVFLSSIQLPAIITSSAVRISFGVFKVLVGKLVKSNHVIPLWGKFTYEHPHQSFKHFSIGKFKCEIKSFLVYNKETGYVMGMVMCKCCGKVRTLHIKYKCDEYGRALDKPAPRIEFR